MEMKTREMGHLREGFEREVFVDVDLAKLKFYDLTFDDVSDAVRFENVTVRSGRKRGSPNAR